MFMRMGRAAGVSRLGVPVGVVGVKFTDTAGLTEACMSGPRDRNATGQNCPGENIDDQNQTQKDKACGPSLTLPICIWRNTIGIDHVREGFDGLVPAATP